MRSLYEILPEAIFFRETNCICEVSLNSFSYFFENDLSKKISGLYVFKFDENEPEFISQEIASIFKEQNLLHKNYKKVFISYSDAENVLLPEELFNPVQNEQLLDTLYGDLTHGTTLTDLITGKGIYNVYRIHPAIHDVITTQFPLATFSHKYSLLIKSISSEKFLLDTIFYDDKIVVTLMKENALQVIQAFYYQSADDIIYHLKNICRKFNIEHVPLRLGGVIEQSSELSANIHSYFPNVTFNALPQGCEFAENLKQVPAHYFSHLFSTALCV